MAKSKSQTRLLADAADELAQNMPKVMGRNRSQKLAHRVQAVDQVQDQPNVMSVKQDIGRQVEDQLEAVYDLQQQGHVLADKRLDNILTLLEDWWRWQRRVEDLHQQQRAMDKRMADLAANDSSGSQDSDSGEQSSGSLLDRWGGGKDKKGKKGGGREPRSRDRRTNRERNKGRDHRTNRERNKGRDHYGKRGTDGKRKRSRPIERPHRSRTGRAGRWATLAAAMWGGYELLDGDSNTVVDAAAQVGADTIENVAQEVPRSTPEAPKTPKTTPADLPTAKSEKGLLSKISDAAIPTAKKAGKFALRHAGTVAVAGFAAKDAWDIHNNKDMTSEEKNREYSKLAGGVAGSAVGGQLGMVAGAAIGQALIPIPLVGAAIGGVAGELIGSLAGEYGGRWLGEKGYDAVGGMQDWMKSVWNNKDGLTVHVESPDIQKIAEAAEAASIANKSGLSTAQVQAMSGYTTGMYGATPSTPLNYGYGSQKVTYSEPRIDYRKEYGYVPYQGVMKNIKPNAKVESRLAQYDDLFQQYGKEQGLDPLLIKSLVRQESQGDPNAVSHSGAVGLAQFMPATAQDMGITDRTDPRQSVAGSAKYMRQLMDKYHGDTKLALAAYNAGMGNVDAAIKKAGTRDADTVLNTLPQITGKRAAETQGYVRNITAFHAQYREKDGAEVQPVPSEKPDSATRTPATDQILAVQEQATPAVPQMLAKPEAKPEPRTNTQTPVAQAPTLDTMPLLITDMGLADLLLSKV